MEFHPLRTQGSGVHDKANGFAEIPPRFLRARWLTTLHTSGLEALGYPPGRVPEPLLGILVAHTSHLLSVLVLYRLGLLLLGSCFSSQSQGKRARTETLALVGALLHVISPAGLFLSAPYAESPFALLSFVGYLLFAQGHTSASPARRDASYLAAGLSFGLATAFRTNGILNGILFAYPFLQEVLGFLSGDHLSFTAIRKTAVLGLGGLLVAAGSIIPQAWAYQTYCMSSGSSGSGTQPRPWCHGIVPSIYNFVQEQYW
ncbi:MAG: mannosyltransferase family protein [Thaumarchaeota archaeon]|nr:mannosyltransferase family protein [Nitrososphaerota archaeon]